MEAGSGWMQLGADRRSKRSWVRAGAAGRGPLDRGVRREKCKRTEERTHENEKKGVTWGSRTSFDDGRTRRAKADSRQDRCRRVRQTGGELRREARKRPSDRRGRMGMGCGGEKGSSDCGRMSSVGWPGRAGNLRSSRSQRAKKASAVSSIHCSSNAAISLRRLAA